MTATTHKALWTALETVIEAGSSLTHSDTVLDPRDQPQTHLDRLFSIDLQSTNSGKYRDQTAPGVRVALAVILRCAWRLNPKNHGTTWQRALDDEEDAIIAVCTASTAPLNTTRRRYVGSTRTTPRPREWLFSDVKFDIEFDLALA